MSLAVELKRQRSISSPTYIEEPLQVATRHAGPVAKEDSVDGETSPTDECNELTVKRQSFSRGFHRSFSLDNMLDDEREFEPSEANGRTQVMI